MRLGKKMAAAMFITAVAPSLACASQSARFGSALLVVGDPEAKVLQVAGQPVSRTSIKATRNQFQGSRLQFSDGPRTIVIDIRDGKVSRIEHRP
jgi:hypothetical protein